MSEEKKQKLKKYRKEYQKNYNEAKKLLKTIFCSLHNIEMTKKTLKFNNMNVNKKKFHMSKKAIDLMSVNVNKIVVSDKFNYNEDCFKYFIGYQKGEIVRPLCIILPQMNRYIKYFEYGSPNMYFLIKDEEVGEKHEQIWNVIKNKLEIKFHSEPVYEYKYLQTKVREYGGVIKTNFLDNGIPKENMHYTCIACITIDSVMRMDKKITHKFI